MESQKDRDAKMRLRVAEYVNKEEHSAFCVLKQASKKTLKGP